MPEEYFFINVRINMFCCGLLKNSTDKHAYRKLKIIYNDTDGDLYLNGNIRKDLGNLNISVQGGSIIQQEGTKISTDNINLTAQDDIKNIDVVNHRTDDLKLNAQSMNGDIDINVSGGLSGDKYLAGNVIVNDLSSNNGAVSLTATGDIKQSANKTTVNADNIKLESSTGSINLQVESNSQAASSNDISAISASAPGNIKLTKNDATDFRIGSIVSTVGDVELKANGKFIDALDKTLPPKYGLNCRYS